MSSFNWQTHLHDEYGDEPDMAEGLEQNPTSEVSIEGKIVITLGGTMFFVALPEKFAGDVRLVSSGADSPEEAYRLTELLRCLKQRKQVSAADGRDVRREFVTALRKQEAQLASQLRKRLKQEVKN